VVVVREVGVVLKDVGRFRYEVVLQKLRYPVRGLLLPDRLRLHFQLPDYETLLPMNLRLRFPAL
jgi:hypothetical protein